jgi:uncharacterized protein (TIGR02646 family)
VIRIDRGEEPEPLAKVRDVELERVRAIAQLRRPTQDDIGTKYQAVKEALWKAQHYKCAYCGAQEQAKRNDVEHYRPKARADRSPGATDDHGYWWLAWTWENLLFACRNCNQAPAKLDKFPLRAGSEALVAEQLPPGKEHPLLLDPAADDGLAHIQFRPTTIGGETRWIPAARDGSERGQWTIDTCKLDAPDQLTLYTAHVDRVVRGECAVIEAAIEGGDPGEVWEAWECTLRRLLAPRHQYVGLTYDALDHFFPRAVRERWGLSLRVLPPEPKTRA